MSLNQLIASYGREAATAPIEGYMRGMQFGAQMDEARQNRTLRNIQTQQAQIQLGELQRTTAPDYIAEQEKKAEEDRQIKNEQLIQVTEASRAKIKDFQQQGKLKEAEDHMKKATPILRAASESDPTQIKDYLLQNKEVLYKYLDDEGDKALTNLLENGTPDQLKNFAELGYAGTTAGMEELQKLKLQGVKNKGESESTLKTSAREKIVDGIQRARANGNTEKVKVLENQLRNLDIKEKADAEKKISDVADTQVANTLGLDIKEINKDDPTSFQFLADSTSTRTKEGENIDIVKSDLSRYFAYQGDAYWGLEPNKIILTDQAEKELEQGQLQVFFNRTHGRKGLYKIDTNGLPRFVSWWNEDWSDTFGKNR